MSNQLTSSVMSRIGESIAMAPDQFTGVAQEAQDERIKVRAISNPSGYAHYKLRVLYGEGDDAKVKEFNDKEIHPKYSILSKLNDLHKKMLAGTDTDASQIFFTKDGAKAEESDMHADNFYRNPLSGYMPTYHELVKMPASQIRREAYKAWVNMWNEKKDIFERRYPDKFGNKYQLVDKDTGYSQEPLYRELGMLPQQQPRQITQQQSTVPRGEFQQ